MTIFLNCRQDRLPVLLLVAVSLLSGCGSKDEIRSYSVAKEDEPKAAPLSDARPVDIAELTDRMMGVIVPAGSQTWYFKVAGPTAAMDKNADKIKEFFQTINVKAGASKPEWKVPEGWEEQPAGGMRAATLLIPADGKPLDLSVIPLPTTGEPGELMSNVNRWRGQLQLPPVDERGLAASTTQLKAGDAMMTLIDLRGVLSVSNMAAPFAGGGPFSGAPQQPRAAPIANGAEQQSRSPDQSKQSSDLPPGHPPVGARNPVDEPIAAPFSFKAPDSWQQQPATGMRKASFIVKDGEHSAEITVIDLLASAPNVADPLENVKRWRGEIGLEPLTKEQVAGIVQKLEVDGKPSDYVELIPDSAKPAESQVGKATIAATVPAGKMVWFFKMRGDRDVVVGQRDGFKSFLESVRFKPADGAGDGN